MKKFLLLLVAVMASVTAWAGASDYYFVGKPTSWVEPSEKNSDFYEQYKLEKSGVVAGQAVYRLALDVAAGDAMFRFYKGLGGWDDGSIGVQENDVPTEFYWSEDMDDIGLMPGKGAISLPDWPGGRMYITLWNNIISVSAEDFRDISMSRYYEANCLPVVSSDYSGHKRVLYLNPSAGPEGTYIGRVYGAFIQPYDRSVYNTGKDLTEDLCASYALSCVGDFVIRLDWAGIAIRDYKQGAEITDPQNIALVDNNGSLLLTVDTNKDKLYFDDNSTVFAVGKLTDYKYPRYSNYESFRKYAITGWSSSVIEVPADKMGFSLLNVCLDEMDDIVLPTNKYDLRANATDEVLTHFNVVNASFYADNWKGGYIKLSNQGYKLYEENTLRLEAVVSDKVTEFKRQSGTNIYKATVADNANKTLAVQVREVATDKNGKDEVVGTYYEARGHNDILLYDGSAPSELFFDLYGGTRLSYPQAGTGTPVTLSIDYDKKTLTSEIEGKVLPVIYMSEVSGSTGVFADCGDGLYSFNNWVDGYYIWPVLVKDNKRYDLTVGDYNKEFEAGSGDANGVVRCEYKLRDKDIPGSIGIASLGMSSTGVVSVDVDTKAETMTIQHPVLMNGFENHYGYYAPRMYVGVRDCNFEWLTAPNIRNINKLPYLQCTVYENGSRIGYKGSVPVGKVRECTLYFGTIVGHSYTIEAVGTNPERYDNLNMGFHFGWDEASKYIDFGNLEEPRTVDIFSVMSNGWNYIYLSNVPEGYLDIDMYKEVGEYKMSITPRYAGVENVTDDALAGAVIAGGDGCIVVDTPAGMTVAVYDLSGRLVREERVDAGRTVLDGIARGLYVANGTKVVVR